MAIEIPIIEIVRTYYTGESKVLEMFSVEDVESISVDYYDKEIEIFFKDDKVYKAYKDEDKSFISIRFTYITELK